LLYRECRVLISHRATQRLVFLIEYHWVSSSITYHPLTIGPDEDILKAAELMEQRKIGDLPVVEEETLVGMMTLSDLINFLIRNLSEHEGNGKA
jgi:CBS domain-containing protein